ncbi:CDP-diacylglycerol-glycerol-3-phosphate 3-phosphatidyltransferase [Mycena olivaceomarginata]|nr:CDP-diacylglycerol-glycerol-3-phosphate 3-phosphatidyltransferase [Mycena olivaceomarginata]
MLAHSLRLFGRVSVTKIWHQTPMLRCMSSASNLHPMIQGFTGKLQQPKFAPTQFYSQILDMIRRAQTRIFISSLYLGSSESELVFLHSPTALNKKPELQIHMLFDLNRSTRPGPRSTAKLLAPLVSQFPDRVHVSFFGVRAFAEFSRNWCPPRFNEGWGTWHAKIYGVDDEVMISGANLNQSYFTDRQDRYIHFTGQRHLSQYCFDFIKTVGSTGPHSFRDREYEISWPIPETHPHHIHTHRRNNYCPTVPEHHDAKKVTLIPLIQAGQFNIRDEETALKTLFEHLNAESKGNRPLLDLTSGYFGLYKEYQDLILQSSNIDCRIVASSPRANGFYGSSGVSGRIPEGYTLLEQRFMNAVQRANRQSSVHLNEWEREGWTYHAKGIWMSEAAGRPPMLTLFGSTNLNSRSAHIDTELSFLMLVPESSASDSLRRQLADELDNLRAHSSPWKGAGRKVRLARRR